MDAEVQRVKITVERVHMVIPAIILSLQAFRDVNLNSYLSVEDLIAMPPIRHLQSEKTAFLEEVQELGLNESSKEGDQCLDTIPCRGRGAGTLVFQDEVRRSEVTKILTKLSWPGDVLARLDYEDTRRRMWC